MSMGAEAAIRGAIRAYNADLTLRGWTALGMGFGSIVLTYGVLLWLMWLASIMLWRWVGDFRGLFIWGGTAAFFAAASVGAWRNDDPLKGLKPLSDAHMAVIAASWAISGMVLTSPRHAVAGFAMLFLHGPASVLEGIGLLRGRLPSDGALVASAARVLQSAERGVRVEDVQPARAGVLLYRILFIKPDRSRGDAKWFVITEKAREAAAAAARARG